MALPGSEERADTPDVPTEALRALVDAVQKAELDSSRATLEAFAELAVEICEADAAVVRLAEPDGSGLSARAVHAGSPSLAAELAGSRVTPGDGKTASRLAFSFSAPIEMDGVLVGSL